LEVSWIPFLPCWRRTLIRVISWQPYRADKIEIEIEIEIE
jgi:hypothetical protein